MANYDGDTRRVNTPAAYRDANYRKEKLFLPCDYNTERYEEDYILPPVTKIENKGHAVLHSAVCAFGARLKKEKKCCCPPKKMWDCSMKNLIEALTKVTGHEADWSTHEIDEAISKEGIGLLDDEDHPKEFGAKYRGLCIRTYDLNESNTYDDVCNEIMQNGPIIAIIQPDEHFNSWSSKSAKEKVYSGYNEKTRHAVTLIGTSSFDGDDGNDGPRYFIAQNCKGEEWGDKGTFRLLSSDVIEFLIPVVPPY